MDELDRPRDERAVRGRVEPAARARWMREGHRDGAVRELVALADALGHAGKAEQAARGETADGDDQQRADDRELPLAPVRAQPPLLRRRRPVAAARRRLTRVAARDGGAVERRVELVLV